MQTRQKRINIHQTHCLLGNILIDLGGSIVCDDFFLISCSVKNFLYSFDFKQFYHNMFCKRSFWVELVWRPVELHKFGCPSLSPNLESSPSLFLSTAFCYFLPLFSFQESSDTQMDKQHPQFTEAFLSIFLFLFFFALLSSDLVTSNDLSSASQITYSKLMFSSAFSFHS